MTGRSIPRLTLHIGFNKTASTWLQKQVFPQLQEVHYAGMGKRRMPGVRRDLMRRMPAYRIFAEPPARWQHRAQGAVEALLGDTSADRPAVVSHERMSSPFDFFGERGKPYRSPQALERSLSVFQGAAAEAGVAQLAILFLTRRQDTYLPAFYAERSDRIPRASQDDFERQVERLLGRDYERYGAFLDYGGTLEALRRAAPQAEVRVLPFELLTSDPDRFLSLVAEHIGEPPASLAERVDTGKRSRSRQGERSNAWRLRPLRGAIVRPQSLRDRLGLDTYRTEVTLTQSLQDAILEAYTPCNERLVEQLDEETAELFREHGYV